MRTARASGEVRGGQWRGDLQRWGRFLLRPPQGRLQVEEDVTRTPITRIFVQTVSGTGTSLDLPDNEARHVFKVLRGRAGDLVEVAGSGGRLFLAELGEGRTATVVEEVDAPGEGAEVSLYQAVPKGGRMDLVVEKATEVGATSIVPLLTERGLVDPRGEKVGRWRRVAEAAARQSLRSSVPEVRAPVAFDEAIVEAGESGVLLHNAHQLADVEDVVQPGARLFVGPEGGWGEGELESAGEAGLCVARLGPYRLRSETAGIVAVARARAALERRARVERGA